MRDNYFITSNRDEKNSRKPAMPPAIYGFQDKTLIYPRDSDAGGSWIALAENGDVAVLLNGGFDKHIPDPPYRTSRGIIFLDIIRHATPIPCFDALELQEIEPFTMIILQNRELYECRWTGQQKYCRQLKNHCPYIWSSATLYEAEIIKKREAWFSTFLNRHPLPTQQDILNFHRFTGDGDLANDLVMNRDTQYATVSLTSIHLTTDRGSMKYLDLASLEFTEKKIEFNSTLQTT